MRRVPCRVGGKINNNTASIIGLLLAAVGTSLIAQTTAGSAYWDVIWRIMMFASVAGVAVGSVDFRYAAMAGATNTVVRQVGGALGPAVIGSIYATAIAGDANASDAFGAALGITSLLLLAAGIVSGLALRHATTRLDKSAEV